MRSPFELSGVYCISVVSDRGQPHKHKNLAMMKIGAFCPWLWKSADWKTVRILGKTLDNNDLNQVGVQRF